MKAQYLFSVVFLSWVLSVVSECGNYSADWESLDSRGNPQWYLDAKFGIFVHWGVYSVPSWATPNPFNAALNPYAEWYWYQLHNNQTPTYAFHESVYGSNFPYQNFANEFRAELWNPTDWANLFANSGAKYIVLTSKHHEGFTNWPSPQSWNWNSFDVGPKRDIVGELTNAVRGVGLEMGLYYSLYEWYNPIYLTEPQTYVEEIMLPQMTDIINTYKPSILWGDGCLDYSSTFWKTPEFLSWVFNESPVCDYIAINDRWGNDTLWKHGGFYVSELGWPAPPFFHGHKFEECRGMAYSFGYNRMENASHYWTPDKLVNRLVWVVAQGGNFLLDVGPTADGRIPVVMQENLLAMGAWLQVNGEAIYESVMYRVTNETSNEGITVFYTVNPTTNALYAHCISWPGPALTLLEPIPTDASEITYLGLEDTTPLKYSYTKGVGVSIQIPDLSIEELPAQYVYVLKLVGFL
eukprot:TRINITY_DN1150_c0_g1_i1.p1 TRINITY_DN1150_c0_g1~~TRINITY_DN1150_c0_g1_i1.p1  ORF type:complete len:465 (+),score=88.69 TRINITY_DN1150_c0_g1_i1:840-2234(+)